MLSMLSNMGWLCPAGVTAPARSYTLVPQQFDQPEVDSCCEAPVDADVELLQLRQEMKRLAQKNRKLLADNLEMTQLRQEMKNLTQQDLKRKAENSKLKTEIIGLKASLRRAERQAGKSERACTDLEERWSGQVTLLQTTVDRLSKEVATPPQDPRISELHTELRMARTTNMLHQRKHFTAQRSQHMLQTAYDGQVASGKDMLQHMESLKAQLTTALADVSTATSLKIEEDSEKETVAAAAINEGTAASYSSGTNVTKLHICTQTTATPSDASDSMAVSPLHSSTSSPRRSGINESESECGTATASSNSSSGHSSPRVSIDCGQSKSINVDDAVALVMPSKALAHEEVCADRVIVL